MKVYQDDPFRFDFILDKGDARAEGDSLRLFKYFLASLTVPEKDLWVNLSPYEKDRIVPDAFGQTEMGRDLLAQDYLLKQITASVIYPDDKVGKEFWGKVYAEALKRYGTTDIPVDTFNKVWITPAKATVYENKDAAYVVESRLKVMLESDYKAAEQARVNGNVSATSARKDEALPRLNMSNDVPQQILRDLIIPILENEVNEGQNFAQLRQVYNSLILATWYKRKVKSSVIGQTYVDQNKTSGIDIVDKSENEKIWSRYVDAFKKGVFDLIKEEKDPMTQELFPRKYFSGGVTLGMAVFRTSTDAASIPGNSYTCVRVQLDPFQDNVMPSGGGIVLSPDDPGVKVNILMPKDFFLSSRTNGLIERIKMQSSDFSMSNEPGGGVRLKFGIRKSFEKVRSFMDFIPWERHAGKMLVAGTIVCSFAALSSRMPERAVTLVDTVLVACILLLDLWARQEKRFLSDHDYYSKVLETFYEKGFFSHGHSSAEVLKFYTHYYHDFEKNLDDNQEEVSLELLAGTLTAEEVAGLRSKRDIRKFEERLLWAIDVRQKKRNEFMKVHDGWNEYLIKNNDPRSTVKALGFYNRNDHGFKYYLNKGEQEKVAELLVEALPLEQRVRILNLGVDQPTAVQKLMYWDLENVVMTHTDMAQETVNIDSLKNELKVAGVSLRAPFMYHAIYAPWALERVFKSPLRVSDHLVLAVASAVCSGLVAYSGFSASYALTQGQLSSALVGILMFGFEIKMFGLIGHAREFRDVLAVWRNARQYQKNKNIVVDDDLRKVVDKFKKETGFTVSWTDSPLVVAMVSKSERKVILSIGWIIKSDRKVDRRRLVYLTETLRKIRRAIDGGKDPTSTTGGIDFTPVHSDMTINSHISDLFDVDNAMRARMQNASGISPVIVSMHSLENVSAFLGIVKAGGK
ncbi:MAG: hypothetical protein WCI27_03180 [Candidatus Omnitrophota bacterium]